MAPVTIYRLVEQYLARIPGAMESIQRADGAEVTRPRTRCVP